MPKSQPVNHGSYSRTRSDHATELAEDYVEAIAEVCETSGSCRVVDLANHFEVSHVTVNRTIGRLVRDGYVKTEPYRPVELTAKGKRLAEVSSQRHAVVLDFLIALGVSKKVAEIDSEGIEHHVSKETLDAMKKYIDSK